MKRAQVLLVLGVFCAFVSALQSECPCSSPDWCKPIHAVPKNEIFAFVLPCKKDTWLKFDWGRITTIGLAANFYDPELMCYAHQHNVRVVTLVDFPKANLLNQTVRHQWVKSNLAYAQKYFLDGVNIDFEEPIADSDHELKAALTALVQETAKTFHTAIPGSQVTFDVPNSPDCTYGRCFDYYSLGKYLDFLFIMDYDEWSVSGVAGANSGLYQTLHGVKRFLQVGIPAMKLLVGVPWYGYDYTCSRIDANNTCYTVSERPLSHGLQTHQMHLVKKMRDMHSHTYAGIMSLLNTSFTGRLWDLKTLSPYFNYKDGGSEHQMWYDDPESLTLKYVVAISLDLRGVGMWHANCLDYSNTSEAKLQREAMWGVLPRFDLL